MQRVKRMCAMSFIVALLIAGNAFAFQPIDLPSPEWVQETLQPWMEKHPGKWEWRQWNRCLYSTKNATEVDLAALLELDGLYGLVLDHMILTDAGLAQVGRLTQLNSLGITTFTHGEKITDAGAAELGNLSRLRMLAFSNAPNVTGAGYAFLKQLSNLNFFESSDIGDDEIDILLPLHSLTHINMQSNKKITAAGLAKLASLPKLAALNVRVSPQLTDDDLAMLETFPALIDLRLLGVTDQGLAHVGRLPKLRQVLLIRFNITDEGIASLANLPILDILMFQQGVGLTDANLSNLAKLTKLRRLDFFFCDDVTEEGIAELRKVMPQCEIRFFSEEKLR